MDMLQIEELFDKINKNKKMYKKFLEKSTKLDEECQDKFKMYKEGKINFEEYKKYKYNFYIKKVEELYMEKETLDSEWEMLNQILHELITE